MNKPTKIVVGTVLLSVLVGLALAVNVGLTT
ncbi:hypothetical protein SAMN05216226_105194 [Halovenus aranensis]|jgi:hypothetical protein|uniref:Uncharacterized protein n=1 Tax=Halovenus aranensis TaxID=890420 RepID=A0A1G8V081_9EURY|nr:hypothetical protein SAMN05216226_105194 [Halovenus aranensis]